MTETMSKKLSSDEHSNKVLLYAIGIVMIGFGYNQVFFPKKWKEYIPAFIHTHIHFNDASIVRVHGSGNITLGLLYLALHKKKIIRIMTSVWWFNVMILCGRHDAREGIRDLPIFIMTLYYANKY